MNPLLEPDAWQLHNPCPGNDWKCMKANAPEHDERLPELGWEPLYSSSKVESLLAECRKQVLLEAAEVIDRQTACDCGAPCDCYDVSAGPYILRRMAEGGE